MKALILVDLQNDFLPWGSIPIEDSEELIPIANQLLEQFDIIVASQDWHPANHKCFAANHPWRMPGQVIDVNGIPQMLWTIHCVQDNFGAEFVSDLNTYKISKIIRKGTNIEVDSYSVFFENDHKKSNGLEEYLKINKIDEVYIMGLTADFGVKYTALDAVRLGFKTKVIIDGCRWYDSKDKNKEQTLNEMKIKGIQIIKLDELK